MIPADRIVVVNPRVRNKKVFKEIVSNIAEPGLKGPIMVAKRQSPSEPRYGLVCGQSRLEAYRVLGQHETDLSAEFVRGVIRLLANGEHRLLATVESGHIPVSIAVEIIGLEIYPPGG